LLILKGQEFPVRLLHIKMGASDARGINQLFMQNLTGNYCLKAALFKTIKSIELCFTTSKKRDVICNKPCTGGGNNIYD
jgi:hypothetical protein